MVLLYYVQIYILNSSLYWATSERVPRMKEMKSVQQVKDLYITSLLELASVSKNISTIEQEDAFATMLEGRGRTTSLLLH